MSETKDKAKASQPTVEELQASVAEQGLVIKNQEATITELIEQVEKLGGRLASGKITLKHKKITYEVIGKNVPTLGLEEFKGAKAIPAEDLEKHPALVERYLEKGHGFIVPVVEG